MSDSLKREAGKAALEFVTSGMKLGIGTGSTAEAFIHELAAKVRDGLEIIGVPTSERTQTLCNELNIPLTTLEKMPSLDLTIDGADEIDPELNLIKGAGGALLREKIVASVSKDMIVIADQSKVVDVLGAFALPIEVNVFGLAATRIQLDQLAHAEGLSGNLDLRLDDAGKPYLTDGGHYILDASFSRISDPQGLSVKLNTIPGVVENGLFTGLATRAIIAGSDGIESMLA